MAKNTDSNNEDLTIDLGVQIKKHMIDEERLIAFLEAKKGGDKKAQGTLVEYVQEKFYEGQKVIVVPDLSYQRFEGIGAIEKVDFTGCKLDGAWFQSVNLKGSTFCEADLSDVTFWNCDMQKVDMRGADLSGCKFDGYGDNWMKMEERNEKFEGMKFSSTEGLMDQYIEKNKEIYRKKEEEFLDKKSKDIDTKEREVASKNKEVNASYYADLSYAQRGYVAAGYTETGNKKYDDLVKGKRELEKQLQEIERKTLKDSEVPYIVSPSLVHIMNTDRKFDSAYKGSNSQFDPGYIKGSDKEAREQEKQYVRMSRENVEEYLKALKDSPSLTINQFAKDMLIKNGGKVIEGAKIVADCSHRKYGNSGVEREVLSGLDFSKANLQEACFSGAVFKNCNFTGANLDKAIFESANITGAKFDKTSARDTNFFYCNLQSASITNCDFKRAFLRGSDATKARVENANFNYANIRQGKWEGVKIENATFNYADLEGISLAGADMRKVQMQQAILNQAVMANCTIIETDLSNSVMERANLTKANIQNSVFNNIKAPEINLSEAQLDEFVSMQGADLENAILAKIKAEKVNFTEANMQGINAEYANLEGAILKDVDASFSRLKNANLKGADARDIKLTGADLSEIDAKAANFTRANMEGINAERANFTEAILKEADLRGSQLRDAILERVDARRADLRNAELERAKLNAAKLEEAKVNDATNMLKAEVEEVKGQLVHEDIDGKETKIAPQEQVRRSEEIHKAEQKSTTFKIFGKIAKQVGGYFQKAAEYVKQPFSSRTGRIVGAVLGAVAVGAIVVSAVSTAGLSLAVIAAAGVGAAAVGAAAGAVGGHFGAKKIGMTTAILAVGGTVMAPGLGTGVGLVAGIAGNQVVKNVTGKTVDEHVANGLNKAGEGLQALGNNISITDEQEKLLAGKKAAKEQYKGPEKVKQHTKKVDLVDIRLQNQELAKQSALGNEIKTESIAQVLDKNKNLKTQKDKAKGVETGKGVSVLDKLKNKITPNQKSTQKGNQISI